MIRFFRSQNTTRQVSSQRTPKPRRLNLEPLEERQLLYASLEVAAVDIGVWKTIDTPTIDERSVEAVQGEDLLFYHEAGQLASEEYGSDVYLDRDGDWDGQDGSSILIKWYAPQPQGADTDYNGRAVTLKSNDYPEIEGPAYLKSANTVQDWWYQVFRSYTGTPGVYPSDGVFSDPVVANTTGPTGLESGKFTLYDGHGPVSAGSDPAVGRVAYTWDGTTLALGTPTQATGLEYSYDRTEDVPGADVYAPQHTWGPGFSGNTSGTVRIKGATDVPDGTQGTIYDCEWESINGIDVYMQREYAGWYYLWQDAGYTIPVVPVI